MLVVEEGQTDYLEQAIGAILRKANVGVELDGKGMLPAAGEYTAKALSDFAQRGWIRQHGKALIIDQPAKLARRARA